MISANELGTIISRLAIADEILLQHILTAAQTAEGRLLPDDATRLLEWAICVRAIRRVTQPPYSD